MKVFGEGISFKIVEISRKYPGFIFLTFFCGIYLNSYKESPPFQINLGFGELSIRLFNFVSLEIVRILILDHLLILLQTSDMGL